VAGLDGFRFGRRKLRHAGQWMQHDAIFNTVRKGERNSERRPSQKAESCPGRKNQIPGTPGYPKIEGNGRRRPRLHTILTMTLRRSLPTI
jgi:hypothetical protein